MIQPCNKELNEHTGVYAFGVLSFIAAIVLAVSTTKNKHWDTDHFFETGEMEFDKKSFLLMISIFTVAAAIRLKRAFPITQPFCSNFFASSNQETAAPDLTTTSPLTGTIEEIPNELASSVVPLTSEHTRSDQIKLGWLPIKADRTMSDEEQQPAESRFYLVGSTDIESEKWFKDTNSVIFEVAESAKEALLNNREVVVNFEEKLTSMLLQSPEPVVCN